MTPVSSDEGVLARQARRRLIVCPAFVTPFFVYLCVERNALSTRLVVGGAVSAAVLVSVLLGDRLQNPRIQVERSAAVAISSGLGVTLLYGARALGVVSGYLALGAVLMVYLLSYWFADSVRILRATPTP